MDTKNSGFNSKLMRSGRIKMPLEVQMKVPVVSTGKVEDTYIRVLANDVAEKYLKA
jgi:hypothetical protein